MSDRHIPNPLNPVQVNAYSKIKDVPGVRVGMIGTCKCETCQQVFTTGDINFSFQDSPVMIPRFTCIQCGLYLMEIKKHKPTAIGCFVDSDHQELTVTELADQHPRLYTAFYDAVNRTKALTGVLEEMAKASTN